MLKAVLLVGLVALVAQGAAQNTFCQRYAAALFGTSTATTQASLLGAVVTATVTGNMKSKFLNISGLINSPLNKPYFDGTKPPMVNFITDAGQYATLADHLLRFFGGALGCMEYAIVNPYTQVDLKAKHAAMLINKATYGEFVGQLAGALISYGVSSATGPNDDLTGPAALLGMFLKGSPAEICSQSDCAMYNDYLGFMNDATTFWVAGSNPHTSSGKLLPGGAVHFDLTAADNIVQADSAAGTTMMSGGMTSGAVGATRSYTVTLSTAGTYWFYSAAAPATKRATIVVALSAGFTSSSVSFMAIALAALFAFVAQRV